MAHCSKGCGHPVGKRGGAHKLCPPPRGSRAARRQSAMDRGFIVKPDTSSLPSRGAPVAGTGKPAASSDKTKKAAAA